MTTPSPRRSAPRPTEERRPTPARPEAALRPERPDFAARLAELERAMGVKPILGRTGPRLAGY